MGQGRGGGKQFEKAIAWSEKAREKVNSMQQEGRIAPNDKDVLSMLERLILEWKDAMSEKSKEIV